MLTAHLLFADRNPKAHDIAKQALAAAFGANLIFHETANVDALLIGEKHHGKVLVVLIEPEMTDIQLALKATSEDSSPRWAMVSLSAEIHSSGLEAIPPEEWNVPLLSRVFRSVLIQHQLTLEKNRLRGDLLTIARRISHDLRTPLSGIFTTAELLNEILSEQSEEDAALTAPLFDSTQAVLKIIDRVSFLGKATVDTRTKEVVDMAQVVWAARQSAERLAIQKNVRWKEPESWPTVEGVPAWLEVMWGNLLTNAVQHGVEGTQVEIYWRELPEAFEFGVRDQGPGIPETKQAKLFQAFQNLHVSHNAHGLGLPIVRRLAELQDGGYGYAPVEGGGSCFYFTLPKGPVAPRQNA